MSASIGIAVSSEEEARLGWLEIPADGWSFERSDLVHLNEFNELDRLPADEFVGPLVAVERDEAGRESCRVLLVNEDAMDRVRDYRIRRGQIVP